VHGFFFPFTRPLEYVKKKEETNMAKVEKR